MILTHPQQKTPKNLQNVHDFKKATSKVKGAKKQLQKHTSTNIETPKVNVPTPKVNANNKDTLKTKVKKNYPL